VLRPAGDQIALTSYWGAKEYDRLKAFPYGLQDTIEYGSLKPLVVPLQTALHWIHDHVVTNYGWAIVLLTILIKIILLPLTHRSTMSMRKMQELNPKVQGIRDRYRTKLRDKQGKPNLEAQRKMNEEVMAVYKEAGVNPAGGCLPLLIQMPILFAFYRLLSTAVDLRGAPWLAWIQDLSLHDPYYVLPIIMGVTQLIQVRMGPQAGDPMQRRMFQIMPVAMTFFFLGVPSGLVLYWLTNNVLTIIQLQVYNRLQAREA
jgi:YidC/Oxa1 family membrane protein insertase